MSNKERCVDCKKLRDEKYFLVGNLKSIRCNKCRIKLLENGKKNNTR
jgi:hypothetical protein